MNYRDIYNRWRECARETDLAEELLAVETDEDAIKERFCSELAFGTAGLRGIIGAGPNRMNVYTVRRATQGLADTVSARYGTGAIAIAYDSRNKSREFARECARVLAANGLTAYIYDRLMPTPMLSFAVRELRAKAGIMITASHNPAQYNGYKAYGADGCQMTSEDADAVYARIQKVDVFDGVRLMPFDDGQDKGFIKYIDRQIIERYYDCVKAQRINPDICERYPIKLVYSPLNGTGNEPVRRILDDIGVADIHIVSEQELPDGDFPTCSYPNPETREALALGLELAKEKKADIFIATDPDCDRAGVAFRGEDGSYRILNGNEIGVLLMWYICSERKANGTLPEHPVAVESIVSTALAAEIAKDYGVEMRRVLTGFKYIGEQILLLEQSHEESRFIFGFEESCGYLAGSYVRDKDAVLASMLLCELTARLKGREMTAVDMLYKLFEKYGFYKNSVESFEFEGLDGKEKMTKVMNGLYDNNPREIALLAVTTVCDYRTQVRKSVLMGVESPTNLPSADAIEFVLENGASVMVRPSGTEPKMKVYLTAKEHSEAESDAVLTTLAGAIKTLIGV